MIKPRSLPSHFELQAEAQQRNFEGETSSRSHTSFNQLNGQSMLPVTPTTSVTTPATIDRDSQVSAPDPITGATSPTSDRGATPQSSDDYTKTFNTIHPRCSSSLLHPIQKVIDDALVTFRVCKLCSGASVSFIQYGLVKHEHCGFLTFSAIPNFCVSDT